MIHSLSISCVRQHIIKRHNFFTASSTFSSISTSAQNDSHHLQSSSSTNSINTQEDWRDWFRSSDYDDAWSSYQPFPTSITSTTTTNTSQQEDTNSINNIDITTTHQKQIIPSISNGTWKRRIFGMNLVPLCMTYNGVSVDECIAGQRRSVELEEQGDTNSNLQQNKQQQQSSPQAEISTVPNNPEVIKQSQKLQRIDTQTRFLCRMLDDLYRTGIWREIDRPRTERCHRVRSLFLCNMVVLVGII